MSGKQQGFTLLELLIVMTIISILVSIGLPQYRNAKRKAEEAVLKENLFRMRDVLDQYHADKGYYPESLETLVGDGYLRKVPEDPLTKTSTSWIIIFEEDVTDRDPNIPIGVYDVKSGAQGLSINGIPFSEF